MIANPVVYSAEQQKKVRSVLSEGSLVPDRWSGEDLEAVRSTIKAHYIQEQQYRCCYCNQPLLAEHGRVWDVEHVIPRSGNEKFMFEPRNLAVSCVECNGNKSATRVTPRDYVRFPKLAKSYLIVHPHYDIFEEHIEMEGDYTYHALTSKGSFTIYHCDLFRYRQRQAKIRRSIKDRRFERDVGELRFALTVNEAKPIVASIMARIKIHEADHASAAPNRIVGGAF